MSTDISSDWELQRIKRELAAAQSALSRFEQAALPEEPERLTMTRKLASGGVATETVVAAHHYDALHIRLARYEAAGRELPEEPMHHKYYDYSRDPVVGLEVDTVDAADYDKLRDFAVAQKVRAEESERDAKRYREIRARSQFEYRNGPGIYWYLPRWNRDLPVSERLDAAIDAAIKEQT